MMPGVDRRAQLSSTWHQERCKAVPPAGLLHRPRQRLVADRRAGKSHDTDVAGLRRWQLLQQTQRGHLGDAATEAVPAQDEALAAGACACM